MGSRMHAVAVASILVLGTAVLPIAGCESESETSGSEVVPGTLGAPCLAGDTCESGLLCESGLCTEGFVNPDVLESSDVAADSESLDTGVVDVGGCQGSGCFGDPCESSDDCFSGLCAPHMGGDVCTEPCEDSCPSGWSCSLVAQSGADPAYICVSDFAHLCLPCLSSDDCASGESQDACVSYGEEGSFCGGVCEVDSDCPEGFQCADSENTRGGQTRQCRPIDGACECSEKAMNLGLVTECTVSNSYGVCQGIRSCSGAGLGACDAPTPDEDVCNGVDDDCDGETDTVPCDDQDPCTVDTCAGEAGCASAPDIGAACDDGSLETANDVCDESGLCAGEPIVCPTGSPSGLSTRPIS